MPEIISSIQLPWVIVYSHFIADWQVSLHLSLSSVIVESKHYIISLQAPSHVQSILQTVVLPIQFLFQNPCELLRFISLPVFWLDQFFFKNLCRLTLSILPSEFLSVVSVFTNLFELLQFIFIFWVWTVLSIFQYLFEHFQFIYSFAV